MNLLMKPGDADLARKIDAKQQQRHAETEKEKRLRVRLDSALDTRSAGGTSSGSVSTVGSMAKKLDVKERDGESRVDRDRSLSLGYP